MYWSLFYYPKITVSDHCFGSITIFRIEACLDDLFQAYASRGYVAIAIDSRYHGERATNKTTYQDVGILIWCTLVMKFWLIDTKSQSRIVLLDTHTA